MVAQFKYTDLKKKKKNLQKYISCKLFILKKILEFSDYNVIFISSLV